MGENEQAGGNYMRHLSEGVLSKIQFLCLKI